MSVHRPDHDPAFEALRAADPAARLSPDTAALDAAVRSRLGTPPDELATARTARGGGRRGRWLAVAAVAAGAVAVGSGGYALGARAGGDVVATGPGTTQAVPSAGIEGGAVGGAAGSAPGASAADARVAPESLSSVPWYGGRTVFTAQGLSDDAGTAEAWAYDPASVFDADTVMRLAAALGLGGEPRLEGGTWALGPTDGTGPSLHLQPDGVASVSYYDPTRDPYACVEPVPEGGAPADGGASSSGDVSPDDALTSNDGDASAPAPDLPACTATDLGDAPTGDAAIARAREVLTAAGVDPDAYELELQEGGTASATFVLAHELIGGQRTGLLWNLTLVEDGVQSMYGALAPLVPLGTYDVVSPNAAVGRLTDPRFGPATGGPTIAAGAAEAKVQEEAIASGEGTEPAGPRTDGTPPAAVQPGAAFTWPVTEVTLTGARLALTPHTEPDGATVLLPAYHLSADDGAVWSVVAVADARLDFSRP